MDTGEHDPRQGSPSWGAHLNLTSDLAKMSVRLRSRHVSLTHAGSTLRVKSDGFAVSAVHTFLFQLNVPKVIAESLLGLCRLGYCCSSKVPNMQHDFVATDMLASAVRPYGSARSKFARTGRRNK